MIAFAPTPQAAMDPHEEYTGTAGMMQLCDPAVNFRRNRKQEAAGGGGQVSCDEGRAMSSMYSG